MPHIAAYETKKAFREAVAEGKDPYCYDPALVGNPVSGRVSEILENKESFNVTNKKRSWFATVKKGKNGEPEVS